MGKEKQDSNALRILYLPCAEDFGLHDLKRILIRTVKAGF